MLVASVGKFGGTYLSSRWCGLPHRSAAALGLLMNTRGLMELIVLTLGLELHILTPSLYAVFVLMALITTFATQPQNQAVEAGASASFPASRGEARTRE